MAFDVRGNTSLDESVPWRVNIQIWSHFKHLLYTCFVCFDSVSITQEKLTVVSSISIMESPHTSVVNNMETLSSTVSEAHSFVHRAAAIPFITLAR